MPSAQTFQQVATPEVLAWVRAQFALGHTVPTILKAMRASGWHTDVAREVVAGTLAAPVPVPVPKTAIGASCRIDTGDRQIDVLMQMQEPHIVVFGNVLSEEECNALMEAARRRLTRSLTVAVKTGGEELNDDRTSRGMFFTRGENELVNRIEVRLARLLDWPIENGEGLQVLQYLPGAEYKPHYDYFDPAESGTPSILQRGGQRVATLIIYLSTPEAGGATVFPDVGLEVAPQRGHAVFFSYDQPHASTLSLHGGAPVLTGEKWVATKWLRQREFV